MVVWIEIAMASWIIITGWVTTCVVVWIEMCALTLVIPTFAVTTCVVVWIEILVVLPLLCPRTVTP